MQRPVPGRGGAGRRGEAPTRGAQQRVLVSVSSCRVPHYLLRITDYLISLSNESAARKSCTDRPSVNYVIGERGRGQHKGLPRQWMNAKQSWPEIILCSKYRIIIINLKGATVNNYADFQLIGHSLQVCYGLLVC